MLLERLKADTAERHERLERELGLMRPDLTRSAWTRLVGRFYGFYRPWEDAVARTTAGGELAPVVAERRKLPWLEQDLTALNLSLSDQAALPRCASLPSLASTAQVLGSMYVFEGATLGGQFISRHVEATLGLSGGRGYTFFHSYGTATGRMWQAFRATLSAYAPRVDPDSMVASACETFDRFHNWIVDGRGECVTCP
jgi:heme oxygenase (biliverdin-IX-beta and delta-forming)